MKQGKKIQNRKFKACIALAELDKKKISRKDLSKQAARHGLKIYSMKTAWDNFQETGGRSVDRRIESRGKANTMRFTAKIQRLNAYNNSITVKMAGDIIRSYMSTKIRAMQICLDNKMCPNQLYDWIHELSTSGTLMGIKVLDPKKYAKLNVLDVIRLRKYPKSRAKNIVALSDGERAQYDRVADILELYLPSMSRKNKRISKPSIKASKKRSSKKAVAA